MLYEHATPELTPAEFDAGINAGYPLLKSRLFRYSRGLMPVEDLVQETMLRAVTNRDKFRGSQEKILPWLITIGRNLAADLRRKQKPQPETVPYEEDTEEGDTLPATESEAARANRLEQKAVLRQEIARLPERERRAFMLIRWREFSYDQAAARLGTTVNSLDHAVRRSTERLRKVLPALSPRFRGLANQA
jgi:RNA polymerase sigma-70 factor, ECF subfamily